MTKKTGLTAIELADKYDLSRSAIRSRLEGVKPMGKNSRGGRLYDPDEAEIAILEGEESPELRALRAQKLKAEIAKLETANKKAARELVNTKEVKAIVLELFKAAYQRIVMQKPRALAVELSRLKDPRKIEALLKKEYQQVFTELEDERFWRMWKAKL
jgi:hypothetical protein